MALKEIAQKLWRRAKLLLLAAVRALYENYCPGTLDIVNYVFHKFKRRRLDPDESGADKQPDLETGGGGRFGDPDNDMNGQQTSFMVIANAKTSSATNTTRLTVYTTKAVSVVARKASGREVVRLGRAFGAGDGSQPDGYFPITSHDRTNFARDHVQVCISGGEVLVSNELPESEDDRFLLLVAGDVVGCAEVEVLRPGAVTAVDIFPEAGSGNKIQIFIVVADSEGDFDYGPRALASAVVKALSIEQVKEDLEMLDEDVEALEEAAGDELEDQELALRKKLAQLEGDHYEAIKAAALAAAPAPASTTGDEEDEDVVKARIATLVEGYAFKELQRELKSRQLRAAGKKQELQNRLKDALLAEHKAENAPKHTCATKEDANAMDPFWATRNKKLEAEEATALEQALDDGEYCVEISKNGVAGERLLVVGDGLQAGVPEPSQPRPGASFRERRILDRLGELTRRGARPQNEAAFAEGGRVQILEMRSRTLGTIVDVIEGKVTAISISRGRHGLDAWQLHTLYTYNVRRDDGEVDYAVEESSLVAFVPQERLGRRRSLVAVSDSDSDGYIPRGTQSRRRSVRVDRNRARQDPDSYLPDADGDEDDEDDEEPLGDGEESDDDVDDNYGDPEAIGRHYGLSHVTNTVTELVCDNEPEIAADLVPQTLMEMRAYIERALDSPVLKIRWEPQNADGRAAPDWSLVKRIEELAPRRRQYRTLLVLRDFIAYNRMDWYREHFSADGHLNWIDHTYERLLDEDDFVIGYEITLRGRVPEDINFAATDLEILVLGDRESANGLW